MARTDEPGERRTSCDLKGMLVGMHRSHACDGPLLRPFHTSTNAPKSTTEKWRGVVTHHAISAMASQLRPTLSSRKAASPDVAVQRAKEGAKAGKKRCKQHCQEAATDDDGGTNERAGGSSMDHIVEVVDCSKPQAQQPTDHFKKLLEETCPDHAYPIKDMLRECGLMKSFMTMGSLSRGMEVDEAPIEGDAAPFPREDTVMTIYGRHPSPQKNCMPDPRTGTLARCSWGWGAEM
jgi:hypothetical protein